MRINPKSPPSRPPASAFDEEDHELLKLWCEAEGVDESAAFKALVAHVVLDEEISARVRSSLRR